MGLSEWFNLAAGSGEYGLQWLVLGLVIIVCALVTLAVLITRQQKEQVTADVDKDYIANDEVSWTELMRILG